jgi:hypothetical protein
MKGDGPVVAQSSLIQSMIDLTVWHAPLKILKEFGLYSRSLTLEHWHLLLMLAARSLAIFVPVFRWFWKLQLCHDQLSPLKPSMVAELLFSNPISATSPRKPLVVAQQTPTCDKHLKIATNKKLQAWKALRIASLKSAMNSKPRRAISNRTPYCYHKLEKH